MIARDTDSSRHIIGFEHNVIMMFCLIYSFFSDSICLFQSHCMNNHYTVIARSFHCVLKSDLEAIAVFRYSCVCFYLCLLSWIYQSYLLCYHPDTQNLVILLLFFQGSLTETQGKWTKCILLQLASVQPQHRNCMETCSYLYFSKCFYFIKALNI